MYKAISIQIKILKKKSAYNGEIFGSCAEVQSPTE